MPNRKKTMLMMFVDYLICLLVQLLGLFVLSWMLQYDWGGPVYSIIFCLLLFGLIYSRAHSKAERDLKRKSLQPAYEGLLLALPLAAFNLILILLFALIQKNIIPIGNIVTNTVYTFPDNEPRIATDILLMDYITSGIRIWFGTLLGFMSDKTSAALLLISPAITLLAGFCGYWAGGHKFFISEVIFSAKEKVKDKFNE